MSEAINSDDDVVQIKRHQGTPSGQAINITEVIRLVTQFLEDCGYQRAADVLQQTSGISMEDWEIVQFREAVLCGNWDIVEKFLPTVQMSNLSADQQKESLFLVRQQKYLELLSARDLVKAIEILQNELRPLCESSGRLHELCSYIMYPSTPTTDTNHTPSREQLLDQLGAYIAPSSMIPKGRLLKLLGQALEWQKRNCYYHNIEDTSATLFSDHVCARIMLPFRTVHILQGHTDEVWRIAFSNNGNYLASVSKDHTCIIWDMETLTKAQVLKDDGGGSHTSCIWSPDDSKLLVCGGDLLLRMWNPITAELMQVFRGHLGQVTCCVWLPDGEHIISGACDKLIFFWGTNGSLLNAVPTARVINMKITKDGRRLVTTGFDRRIRVHEICGDYRIVNICEIPEQHMITSLDLSADGRFLLTNIQKLEEIHLWSLEEQRLVQSYSGHKHASYVIRSALGGVKESFIVSGSEDNRIYVWSKEHRQLLEVLQGHSQIVNDIAWCPINRMRFASASDDSTVRMWSAPINPTSIASMTTSEI